MKIKIIIYKIKDLKKKKKKLYAEDRNNGQA